MRSNELLVSKLITGMRERCRMVKVNSYLRLSGWLRGRAIEERASCSAISAQSSLLVSYLDELINPACERASSIAAKAQLDSQPDS